MRNRRAKLHEGTTWAVMLLPWRGLRDMWAGFKSPEAAREFAHKRGYDLDES